jgi:hypothetical protein
MSKDRITIRQRHGSHLLVERDGRWSIVERRDDGLYSVDAEARQGHPDDEQGMAAAAAATWSDEATAKARFQDIVARGEALARKIW